MALCCNDVQGQNIVYKEKKLYLHRRSVGIQYQQPNYLLTLQFTVKLLLKLWTVPMHLKVTVCCFSGVEQYVSSESSTAS